jgi:hypothetical protein
MDNNNTKEKYHLIPAELDGTPTRMKFLGTCEDNTDYGMWEDSAGKTWYCMFEDVIEEVD